MANAEEIKKNQKRVFNGVVKSAPGQKTVSVEVVSIKANKKYQKQYKTTKRYPVHDEKNVAKVGDEVRFEECRPISRTKRWRLARVLNNE